METVQDTAPTNPDLKLCWDALAAKRIEITRKFNYYDGKQPLAFKNPKLYEVLGNSVFVKNWCSVVVNVSSSRLGIQSWDAGDMQEQAEKAWKTLSECADDLHSAALKCGHAYLVCDLPDVPDASGYFHDPRQCCVIMDEANPRVPRVACKTWTADKKWYMNLYYADSIWKYKSEKEPSAATAYVLQGEPESHAYGIPVFEFRINDCGELTDGVLSLQDALNQLLNDMMVSSGFCGFPQKWGIGAFAKDQKWPSGPGTMLTVEGSASDEQSVQFGSFAVMSPEVYTKPMDDVTLAIAAETATPKHFFHAQGGDPSGEALAAMESPLVAKVEKYGRKLGRTWERAMAFLLQCDADDIEVVWCDPHTAQPKTKADTMLVRRNAGMPLEILLQEDGYSEEQIQAVKDALTQAPQQTAVPGAVAPTGPTGLPTTRPAAEGAAKAAADAVIARLKEAGTLDKLISQAGKVKKPTP